MTKYYEGTLAAAAKQYGVPDSLLTAQIQQESGFNPNAVSAAGAQGIAQFMPATAQEIGLANPFDPTTAIAAAAKYDAQNYSEFGNWPQTLEAYNEGPTAVSNGTVYPQSKSYAATILTNAGMTNSTQPEYQQYVGPNGNLHIIPPDGVIPTGGVAAGNSKESYTSAIDKQAIANSQSCPINDTPILSIAGYALITPCGLFDLVVGILGIVFIVAGFKSDAGQAIVQAAKSIPLE